MKRLLLAVTLVTLAGCSYYDTRHARDPLTGPMIGMGFPDLYHCMGPYDAWSRLDKDVFDMTWTHVDNSAGLKATLALVGSISLGGGGGCKANATVLRDGTVVGLNFPQSYSNGLLSTPYASCAALVSECLGHPDSTGRSPGYDVSVYLDPAKQKK